NGLEAALEAACILKQRNRRDIIILLVGSGKLTPLLKKRIVDESLDNVIIHDPVNKEKVAGLMASTDIGLQLLANIPAFYYGTSPNKFFDYIAAGLPVLNNYPGWLSDMIKENKCGFSVAPDSPEAFADALEAASADREALRSMGSRARTLAERSFNREELSNQFVDWLESVIRK